jgi:hypothetical protein
MTDPLFTMIANLPQAAAPPEHSRRTREKCHRAQERRREPTRRWPVWERGLVALGTMYVAEALRLVAAFYGSSPR